MLTTRLAAVEGNSSRRKGLNPNPILRRVLGAACCIVLLVGCQVPGATNHTIKVGLVAPFEGRYRYLGYDLFPAVRLALREANAAGGVGGYGIELVAYDDGADPDMASLQARKLAIDPEVVAVISHFREQTAAAAVPVYTEVGLPLVASGELSPQLASAPGVIHTGSDTEALAASLLERVTSAALVHDGGILAQALLEIAGDSVGLVVDVSVASSDWLDQVLAPGVEQVVCDADPVTCGEVVVALRAAGWEGILLGGPGLAATDFASVGEEAAQGTEFVTPWPLPGDVAESEDFTIAYAQVSGGPPPGPLAMPAYDSAQLILRAIERVIAEGDTPSRENMAAALQAAVQEVPQGSLLSAALYWYRIGPEGIPELLQRVDP
jgi:branched-chain amino acid transport system substrate-binding protein